MTLGKTIHRARKAKGLFLKDLADAVDYSLTYINDIEQDRRKPSVELVRKLAKALDLDEEELRAMSRRFSKAELAYIESNPAVFRLVGALMKARFGPMETDLLVEQVRKRKKR